MSELDLVCACIYGLIGLYYALIGLGLCVYLWLDWTLYIGL